jgi:hypothetical protein
VSDVPDEVRALAEERERARRASDFAAADRLRERIRQAGFELTDTPSGPQFARREAADEEMARPTFPTSDAVPNVLADPPAYDASVQWVVQGWPEDVRRGIEAFRRSGGEATVQHLVVDATETGPGSRGWPEGVEEVRMAPGVGWAAARNAGLRRAGGTIIVIVDGCVEPTGDAIAPLLVALRDPSVGVTGPFGLVSDDLREFRESEGPHVDAVEGYVMAFRRELVEAGLRFDEKFKFYRTADIELSFQVKALGLRATVTPLSVIRHEHRMWANTPEEDRARLSKRNFYRFLDRWRGRTDLLVGRR